MLWDVVFGAFLLWMIAGGGYQLVTGRDAWIATFRSQRVPSPREIRISGALALVVGLILMPVFVGLIAGALGPR
ncbi:MAG TPA: hypothetical protein VND96_10200 [Candidatus Micrarchaeaceae archaeon]|nr:hypothetical protein [Candidatus Micrarchaeaceae archaeon]